MVLQSENEVSVGVVLEAFSVRILLFLSEDRRCILLEDSCCLAGRCRMIVRMIFEDFPSWLAFQIDAELASELANLECFH